MASQERNLNLPLYPSIVVAFLKDAAHFHRDAAAGDTLDDKEQLTIVRSFESRVEFQDQRNDYGISEEG